ncbi:MAG: PKD domain-containing protein, partial [Candidatus Thermoplasmatota archaeon]
RLVMNLSRGISASVDYTPLDNKVNGQPNGDSPAWLLVTFPGGRAVRLFHDFNTQHESTWSWSFANLLPLFLQEGVTFQARLHDPGADGLTAHWDFGDGTNRTQLYPNGPPSESPEGMGGVSPFDVTAIAVHAYAAEGTYVVTLTVDDGDGGIARAVLTLTLS